MSPQRKSHAAQADPLLLEILVCPLTHTNLSWNSEKSELVSRAARLAFPVRAGVPILIESQARQLDDDEIQGGGGA